ncbi:MAG: restriction endonuclease [Bacteroidales bacterium]|nr:restriction endonuclease [Bacteroidales bacterium]
MEHNFTKQIKKILTNNFGKFSEDVFQRSELLQYINIKTVSANRGSKSRGSFGNLYAIYVLIDDYLKNKFDKKRKYDEYEGAIFSALFSRQRELPFGAKLQNHALNHRMNQEFKKTFPTCDYTPIIRVVETKRYWINENLLNVKIDRKKCNIAKSVIEIIDKYIDTKKSAFDNFINTFENLKSISSKKSEEIENFILDLLAPNFDARIFEIVSFSILKYFFNDKSVFWGFEIDKLEEENLKLYKTGRTNANDGGIDFVMKPLGRFFQVTETLDLKKYFLDIDKIEKSPITFVIKTEQSEKEILKLIKEKAQEQYLIKAVVKKYMECIEEIINIDTLRKRLNQSIKQGNLKNILNEILIQSKVEFNYD